MAPHIVPPPPHGSARPPKEGNQWGTKPGITFPEMIIAMAIISLVLATGLRLFQNAQKSTTRVAVGFSSQIRLRQACDKLTENLFEGTEIVQPAPGMTIPFLVIKDITNNLVLLCLEKLTDKQPESYTCVKYIDRLIGASPLKTREVLFDGVKELRFTTLTPGLVIAHLTLHEPGGKDLAGLVEVRMKNLGGLDP
jgi:hypothetical protein